MSRTEILGVELDAVTKRGLLASLQKDLKQGKPVQVVTVNNEIIMRAAHDPAYRRIVNAADYRIPDSAGTLWASSYLAKPLRGPFKRIRLRTQAFWLLVWLAIWPSRVTDVLPETVRGSELTDDLTKLCAVAGYPLYLLGGGPGVAEAAAERLREQYPKLQVSGSGEGKYIPSPAADTKTRNAVAGATPRVVLVAYGAPKQEQWISRNLKNLPKSAVAVGVGGTLDYIAGAQSVGGGGSAKQPPAVVRRNNFEWLWRLVTQPSRWRRIMTAFPKFVGAMIEQKRTLLGLDK